MRSRLLVALTSLVVLVCAAGAFAAYTAAGTGTGRATIGSIIFPAGATAQQNGTDVAVSWNAATLSSGGSVQGYSVTRSDGKAICGTPTLVTGTSCTDSNVLSGTYYYTITAVEHTFTAAITTGTIVVADATISLNPTSGLVGTTVTLSGSHFPANASIAATYDGGQLALSPANPMTGATGAIPAGETFVVPTSAAGAHTVQVTAGGTNASATFTVFVTSVDISPTTGQAGVTPISFSGSGWPASTSLRVNVINSSQGTRGWCTISSDSSGTLTNQSCTVPTVPAGTYTVQVTNNAGSTANAAHQLTITPSAQISPTSGSPGATTSINGHGFAASSAISATFDGAPMTVSGSLTTDTNGTIFGTSLQIPASATAGVHTIQISDAAGNSVSVSYTVFTASVDITPTTGQAGVTTISFSGSGWPASTSFNVDLINGSQSERGWTAITSNSSGSLNGQTALTATAFPAGTYTVRVTNRAGIQADAPHQLTITPSAQVSPTSGSPGTTTSITAGHGFAASSAISATFDGSPMTVSGSTTTDINGTISNTNLQIPASATAGAHTIQISDTAGNSVSVSYTVFATSVDITPTTGQANVTTISFSGSGWPASASFNVDLFNGSQSERGWGTINSNSAGSLNGQTLVTTAGFPAGTYTVRVTNHVGIQADAPHQLTITPSAQMSPTSGSPGATITLTTGHGFAPSSAISATFDGNPLTLSASFTTDINGTFCCNNATFQVPAGAASGTHTVRIKDAAGNFVDDSFTVP